MDDRARTAPPVGGQFGVKLRPENAPQRPIPGDVDRRLNTLFPGTLTTAPASAKKRNQIRDLAPPEIH